jgi:hypothetical protein
MKRHRIEMPQIFGVGTLRRAFSRTWGHNQGVYWGCGLDREGTDIMMNSGKILVMRHAEKSDEDEEHKSTNDFPGLVRAADLIGQLADTNYLRKQPALFNEFRETGTAEKLGYKSVEDLRADYPHFFWKTVRPYIGDALRYLRITQEGKQWTSNLYANVFSMEHRGQTPGP